MANIDPLLERNQHFATDVDTGLITTVIPAPCTPAHPAAAASA